MWSIPDDDDFDHAPQPPGYFANEDELAAHLQKLQIHDNHVQEWRERAAECDSDDEGEITKLRHEWRRLEENERRLRTGEEIEYEDEGEDMGMGMGITEPSEWKRKKSLAWKRLFSLSMWKTSR